METTENVSTNGDLLISGDVDWDELILGIPAWLWKLIMAFGSDVVFLMNEEQRKRLWEIYFEDNFESALEYLNEHRKRYIWDAETNRWTLKGESNA